MPTTYRRMHRWVPHVGDIVPNFKCTTTQGALEFFDWAEGKWTFLLNQPFSSGTVGTTEMAALAMAREQIEERNTQVLSISADNLMVQEEWVGQIKRDFGLDVWFPMVADSDYELSELFGMSHWKDKWADTVRKTLLIDPNLKVKLIMEQPINLGRSLTEMLRILDAEQLFQRTRLNTSCDWQHGDPGMVPVYMDEAEVQERYGGTMMDYLLGFRLVKVP